MHSSIGVILSALFFVSPIMYNLSFIQRIAESKPWILELYMMNPIAIVVTAYRSIILPDVDYPWSGLMWISIAACVGLLVFAFRQFEKKQKQFADML